MFLENTMARNSILGVFAKSPIKPLEQHIRIATKCCKQLVPFFDACTQKNWDEAEKVLDQVPPTMESFKRYRLEAMIADSASGRASAATSDFDDLY